MALTDWQYRYDSPTGASLTIGDGTDFDIVEIDGLEGFATRVGDQDLPRGHGQVPGLHLSTGRQILLSAEFTGPLNAGTDDLWAELVGAFALSETELGTLTFKQPGRPERQVSCRPTMLGRRLDDPQTRLSTQPIILVASDPRIYSATLHQQTIPLYTPGGGGINYPVDYPKNFAAGVPLEAVLTNDGNASAWPTFRFFGPSSGTITAVEVENRTTGESIEVVTDILSGQILTVDGTAYVTGNGDLVVSLDGSSRYGAWSQPRQPLALVPGDNVLRFTLTGSATSAACIATWRDTDLS